VFTGDTLFIGGMLPTKGASCWVRAVYAKGCELRSIHDTGCGRFFEGNATEMHKALNEVLAVLPDDTKVYVSLAPPAFVNTFSFIRSFAYATHSPATNTQKATCASRSACCRTTRSRR